MKTFERNGEVLRLEVYANGGARATVAAFELCAGAEPRAIGTDSINLNRASERGRWAAALPEPLRIEAEQIASEMGVEVERWRVSAGAEKAKADQIAAAFPSVEAWHEPVSAGELLEALCALYQCYIVMPVYGFLVLALWTIHTYVADVADYTPYIHLSSPVRGCGKSTVQQLLEHTANRACRSDGITAAALYRRIDRMAPTMLLDELDTRLRGDSGELLRGVLNSGFQRGGRITICVGDDHEERDFRTFCPKCLAGIGRLWDTVASRSIALRMEKASRAELTKIKKLRGDRVAGICEPHRRKLQRWANDIRETISNADPEVPDALEARQADVWRPLLAVADLAGGEWPVKARAAALALSGIAQEEGDYGLLLLEDVRDLFRAGTAIDGDKLPSERIVRELGKREDRPWPEFRRDNPITATQLAKLLGRFGIKPHNLRLPLGEIVKGYRYADCQPAFDRYLQIPSASAATSATSSPEAHPSTTVADVAARIGGVGDDSEYELVERMGMRDD